MTIQGWAWAGTGLFSAVAAAAAAYPDRLSTVAVVVDVVLLAAGCVAFGFAYLGAIRRSRTDAIGIGGLFFLAGGCAPAGVRRSLLGALVVQTVVALVTAGIRPYTDLAAGVLVPVYGVALCGLWASRYGTFEPRRASAARPARPEPGTPPAELPPGEVRPDAQEGGS